MESSPILNDYVFKQVFGQRDDSPVLISFLNAMLNGDIKIKSAKIKNAELPKFCEIGRTVLLDVQVQTDDDTYIDIEVQNGYKSDLIDRMFLYGSNMVNRYSEKATRFDKVHCIAIWILNCNMPEFKKFGNEPIIGEFNFRSLTNPEKYISLNGLKIYPVELKKGNKILDLSLEKQTWINFLNNSSNNISVPMEIGVIHEAYKTVQYVTGTPEYRNYIDAINKTDKVYEVNFNKAIEETGRKKLKEGLEKGLKTGLEKGKKEGEYSAKIETAKNMLQKGLDIGLVSQCTGLSIDIIKEIKQDE